MTEEKHYTCPECGAESDEVDVCFDEKCLREDQPLIECTCTDGEHGDDNDDHYYA